MKVTISRAAAGGEPGSKTLTVTEVSEQSLRSRKVTERRSTDGWGDGGSTWKFADTLGLRESLKWLARTERKRGNGNGPTPVEVLENACLYVTQATSFITKGVQACIWKAFISISLSRSQRKAHSVISSVPQVGINRKMNRRDGQGLYKFGHTFILTWEGLRIGNQCTHATFPNSYWLMMKWHTCIPSFSGKRKSTDPPELRLGLFRSKRRILWVSPRFGTVPEVVGADMIWANAYLITRLAVSHWTTPFLCRRNMLHTLTHPHPAIAFHFHHFFAVFASFSAHGNWGTILKQVTSCVNQYVVQNFANSIFNEYLEN